MKANVKAFLDDLTAVCAKHEAAMFAISADGGPVIYFTLRDNDGPGYVSGDLKRIDAKGAQWK